MTRSGFTCEIDLRPVEIWEVSGAAPCPPGAIRPEIAVRRYPGQNLVERRLGSKALCEARQPVAAATLAIPAGDADDDVGKRCQRLSVHRIKLRTKREHRQAHRMTKMLPEPALAT
jgi:hypothetical protein